MFRLRLSRALATSGRPPFSAPPPALSAVGSALLEPLIALLVFWTLWQAAAHVPSRADQALLLLWLALTFPAPDLLGRPLAQRVSEGLVSGSLVAGVLLLCGWATRSLDLVDLRRWTWWAVITPVLHQVALGTLGLVLQQARLHADRPRAVVVGAGPTGLRVARALRRARDAQGTLHHFIGWVDPRWTAPSRALRLGGLEQLSALVRHGKVDEVYIASDGAFGTVAPEVWDALHDSTVAVHVVPDLSGALLLQGRVRTLEGLPVVSLLESPFTGLHAAVKRIEDVVLASVALLLLWPLMLVIAGWVRVDSPGPILFRQKRLGMGGRVIEVWKFRTMTLHGQEAVRQATRDDPRITRAGRLLRRTSLDELPQFINVLQGRMSVVGPRPHALVHNEQYRGLVRAYMQRHKVRPGITGWAQVNGLRGETDTVDKMRRRIEHDLDYLRNWSPSLDLQIVLRTIGLVFRDAHAW